MLTVTFDKSLNGSASSCRVQGWLGVESWQGGVGGRAGDLAPGAGGAAEGGLASRVIRVEEE